MEKHYLVTVSNQSDHLFGVRFICSFFNEMVENKVTLLHICKVDSHTRTLTTIWDNPRDSTAVQIPLDAKKSIQKAQKILSENKVPLEHVLTKAVLEKHGKVKDILSESAQGKYDAIVLGRRVSYALQWMFEQPADETFLAMIKEHSCVSPFWICPDVPPNKKNVLLCIDGSENGYRAVDHVGFILASQPQHKITILHVENSVGTECVEYFRRAEKILFDHKVAAKCIRQKVVWGLSISGTIISEAKKGNYAVVAMGMGGQKSAKARVKMAGATTTKLISKLGQTSLWCCP